MKFDAITFLETLFSEQVYGPADLPGDWFVLWDERAAITEADGGSGTWPRNSRFRKSDGS